MMRWARLAAMFAQGSSSSSLVVTMSFVLVAVSGTLGVVAALSQPPGSPLAVRPTPSMSPDVVVAETATEAQPSDLPTAAPSNPPGSGTAPRVEPKRQSPAGAKVAPPSPAPPGPASEPQTPVGHVVQVLPRAFEVECLEDHLNVRYGSSATFDCTLDGWSAVTTNVTIRFFSGTALEGSCGQPQAFSASPPVISRSPHQAPTSFTVTVDTLRGGPLRGPIRIGTESEAGYDQVEIALQAAPGESLKPCNPAGRSS